MQGRLGSGRFKNLGQRFLENPTALRAITAIEWKHFIEYFLLRKNIRRVLKGQRPLLGV